MQTKTPAHTLISVRNNQRRHRQRRRGHINFLEKKLEETECHLSQAKAEIAALKTELAKRMFNESTITLQNAGYPSMLLLVENKSTQLEEQEELTVLEAPEKLITAPTSMPLSDATLVTSTTNRNMSVPTQTTTKFNIEDIPTLSIVPSPSPSSHPSGNHTEHRFGHFAAPLPKRCCILFDELPTATFEASSYAQSQDLEILPSGCDSYPASDMESTTLCSQAYSLIAQQNFRGLNADTIRSWLDEGFRRARFEEEGCRVETGCCLDYSISSAEPKKIPTTLPNFKMTTLIRTW
jgi:hypothetical protein